MLIISGCFGQKTNPVSNKKELFNESVSSIELFKKPNGNSLYLPKIDYENFIKHWNKSETAGIIEFKPDYFLNVNLTDGSVRKFRANSKYIKEGSDWCYTLEDSTFFEDIFTMKIKENSTKTQQ